jgi:LmbE family N-acetylglucosaminyl deacetylase
MRARELPERVEDWSGRTIACFGAHPDDDLHAAGTFARLVAGGNDVHLVMYTNDDKGSRDRGMTGERLARIRRAEQEAAAACLGIPRERLHWLGHRDGELEYVDRRLLVKQVTAVIRRLRPDALFSFDPGARFEQLHKSDHRCAAVATIDAVRAAHWHLYFPELLDEGLEPWDVRVCFFYDSHEPNYWVDVAKTLDAKIEAFCSHVSQFGRRADAYEASMHPDDRARFERAIRAYTAGVGAPHGLAHAEAFRRATDH